MDGDLEDNYPEAAPLIRKAVKNHSEDWVIENYFPHIEQLGVMMDIPAVEELPFFDADRHDVPTEQEKREWAEGYRKHWENIRTGKRPRRE